MFNKNETTLSDHRLLVPDVVKQTLCSNCDLNFSFFLRATQNEDAEINDFIRSIICVDFFFFYYVDIEKRGDVKDKRFRSSSNDPFHFFDKETKNRNGKRDCHHRCCAVSWIYRRD